MELTATTYKKSFILLAMYAYIKPCKLDNIVIVWLSVIKIKLLKRLKLSFKVYKLLIIYTNICSIKEQKNKAS